MSKKIDKRNAVKKGEKTREGEEKTKENSGERSLPTENYSVVIKNDRQLCFSFLF